MLKKNQKKLIATIMLLIIALPSINYNVFTDSLIEETENIHPKSLSNEKVEEVNKQQSIYELHKGIVQKNVKIKQEYNKPKKTENLKTTLSYRINDSENFYILNSDLTSYTTIITECIEESNNAYFFVQSSIISIFGRESIDQTINTEKNIFENQIIYNETNIFGNLEGTMGNIGDGKVIVLLANLPSGVAGYFDPMNEYTQEYLNDNGMSEYKTNEWEMIYIDYLERYETTLAHEFQHLIHFNHDIYESRWFDEGCAELAGLITGTQPLEWNNITPFADSYFRYHSDDSLTYWNFWSDGGRDVRIDYGGAYMFLLYLYEQLGTENLRDIVNDTLPAVHSISNILSNNNKTFNDFMINWQTALLLDDTSIDSKYGFKNVNFTISTHRTVTGEYSSTINARYYGFYTVHLNYTEDNLETTILNSNNKVVGMIAIYRENNSIIKIEQTVTTSSALLFLPTENFTDVLLSFSLLNTDQPSITGAFGIGSTTTIQIRNVDPYYLSINSPSFILNSSYFSIYGLNILFINGTDIIYGNEYDNVFITIFNESYIITEKLVFEENYYGWGKSVNISHLMPGIYYVNLNVTTANYYYNTQLYSFEIEFEILFSVPLLIINNITKTLYVECNISVNPNIFSNYISSYGETYAYFYNSTHHYINRTVLTKQNPETWKTNITTTFLKKGQYYVYIRLIFEGKTYNSFRSNVVLYTFSEESTISNIKIYIPIISSIGVIMIVTPLLIRLIKRRRAIKM